jgi:Cytochrome c553
MKNRLVAVGALLLVLPGTEIAAAGDPEAGKDKSQLCQSCHGADGNSMVTQFPRLAGQYEDYLVKALKAYKSGGRKNPIMSSVVQALSEEDIENLAAYYARQNDGLYVPEY